LSKDRLASRIFGLSGRYRGKRTHVFVCLSDIKNSVAGLPRMRITSSWRLSKRTRHWERSTSAVELTGKVRSYLDTCSLDFASADATEVYHGNGESKQTWNDFASQFAIIYDKLVEKTGNEREYQPTPTQISKFVNLMNL